MICEESKEVKASKSPQLRVDLLVVEDCWLLERTFSHSSLVAFVLEVPVVILVSLVLVEVSEDASANSKSIGINSPVP